MLKKSFRIDLIALLGCQNCCGCLWTCTFPNALLELAYVVKVVENAILKYVTWHQDYFELKALEKQQLPKVVPPLSA